MRDFFTSKLLTLVNKKKQIMKIKEGSLVVYLKDGTPDQTQACIRNNYKIPVIGKVYTVREIQHIEDRVGLLLEEIVNPIIGVIMPDSTIFPMECGFDIKRFGSLFTPIKKQAKIKEIKN